MQQVLIDGITYTKATDVADEFGYTSDYVGQLCRESEISCRKVGRSWFVDIATVVEYRANRHRGESDTESESEADTTKVKINSGLSEKTSNNKLRNDVTVNHDNKKYKVAVKARAAKVLPSKRTISGNYTDRITWRPLQYENDSEELLPKLAKKEAHAHNQAVTKPPVRLTVDAPDAKALAVAKTTEPYSMESTEIPKVALNGTLKIQSFEPVESDSETKNIKQNKAIPQSPRQLLNSSGKLTIPKRAAVPQSPQLPDTIHSKPAVSDIRESDDFASNESVQQTPFEATTDVNASMQSSDTSTESPISRNWFVVIHLLAITLVLVSGLLLYSLESVLVATDAQSSEQFIVDFSWLSF